MHKQSINKVQLLTKVIKCLYVYIYKYVCVYIKLTFALIPTYIILYVHISSHHSAIVINIDNCTNKNLMLRMHHTFYILPANSDNRNAVIRQVKAKGGGTNLESDCVKVHIKLWQKVCN